MKSRIDVLEVELTRLAGQGCFPVVSLRGFDRGKPVWRAHVNGAGGRNL